MIEFWNDKLPNNPREIGVSMSGGVDSTLALILVCERFVNIDIYPAVGEDINRASNLDTVNKILKVIRELYPWNTIHKPIVNYYDKFDPSYEQKIDPSKLNVEVVVVGKSIQPDHIDVGRPIGSIPETHTYDTGVIKYSPFYKYDKKDIIAEYERLGLKDKIIPLTVSCINMMKDNLTPCGKCDWCREREWALGSIY